MIDAVLSPLWSRLPRSWREPLDVARRDVAHLARRLRGDAVPQTIARSARHAAVAVAPSPTARGAFSLRVLGVDREADDAVSLTLARDDGAPITFAPGQFLSLELDVGGRALRRAYSISSSARDPSRVTVTVRRVPGGVGSAHLHDAVKPGDTLRATGPSGAFTVPRDGARRHHVLVAGGSGITPMMAMLRTHLGAAPELTFTLLYGNRDRAHAIFADALDALAAQHPAQLTVRHVYESAADGAPAEGRLDVATCARCFDALALPDGVETAWWICGPTPMMAAAREALAARGVAPSQVREERFFSAHDVTRPQPSGAPRRVTLRVGGVERSTTALAGATLLDAGLGAGVAMPHSCTLGGCGACRVRLLEGTVTHDEPNCLTDRERDAGYALACCARPDTDVRVEVTP